MNFVLYGILLMSCAETHIARVSADACEPTACDAMGCETCCAGRGVCHAVPAVRAIERTEWDVVEELICWGDCAASCLGDHGCHATSCDSDCDGSCDVACAQAFASRPSLLAKLGAHSRIRPRKKLMRKTVMAVVPTVEYLVEPTCDPCRATAALGSPTQPAATQLWLSDLPAQAPPAKQTIVPVVRWMEFEEPDQVARAPDRLDTLEDEQSPAPINRLSDEVSDPGSGEMPLLAAPGPSLMRTSRR